MYSKVYINKTVKYIRYVALVLKNKGNTMV